MIGEELGNLKYFTTPLPNPPHQLRRHGASQGEGTTPSNSFPLSGGGKVGGMIEYYLDLEKSVGQLVFRKKGILGKEITIDLAFPAFHGANGEDGTIQGLFEIFDIPYVGCGVASSAVAMDKILTKKLYEAHGIPTTKFLHYAKKDWQQSKDKIIVEIRGQLKFPVFVKPASLGSSIAVAKVKDLEDLENPIEVALHYDRQVLIEEGIADLMDVTCAVLGNDEPQTSLLQESVYSAGFLSYEDKYLNDGGSQTGKSQKNVVIPARLDDQTTAEIRELALKTYKLFGCSGIARVDFLFDQAANKYFVNEINTLPGTLYHHLWQKSGIELNDLLTKLIRFAQERHEQKKQFISTFESDILKQARGIKLKKDAGEK